MLGCAGRLALVAILKLTVCAHPMRAAALRLCPCGSALLLHTRTSAPSSAMTFVRVLHDGVRTCLARAHLAFVSVCGA